MGKLFDTAVSKNSHRKLETDHKFYLVEFIGENDAPHGRTFGNFAHFPLIFGKFLIMGLSIGSLRAKNQSNNFQKFA